LRRSESDGELDGAFAEVIRQHKEQFVAAMDDDFNTPQALAVLFDFGREVNTLLNSDRPVTRATLEAIDNFYRTLGGNVLGLIPDKLPTSAEGGLEAQLMEQLMELILRLRAEARARKDWATADAIRAELAKLGIVLEDRPEGTTWRMVQ
jgi:cysteinyl-tRNA synthetase